MLSYRHNGEKGNNMDNIELTQEDMEMALCFLSDCKSMYNDALQSCKGTDKKDVRQIAMIMLSNLERLVSRIKAAYPELADTPV